MMLGWRHADDCSITCHLHDKILPKLSLMPSEIQTNFMVLHDKESTVLKLRHGLRFSCE